MDNQGATTVPWPPLGSRPWIVLTPTSDLAAQAGHWATSMETKGQLYININISYILYITVYTYKYVNACNMYLHKYMMYIHIYYEKKIYIYIYVYAWTCVFVESDPRHGQKPMGSSWHKLCGFNRIGMQWAWNLLGCLTFGFCFCSREVIYTVPDSSVFESGNQFTINTHQSA